MAEPFLVRRATADDAQVIASVHVASWEENYRGILEDRMFEERPLEVRVAQWVSVLCKADRVTFVAEERGGTVAGFASGLVCTPPVQGFDAYLGAIYLIARTKERGIGRALVRAIAAEFLEKGCKNMALRVLRENPARAFYERLGARLVPEGAPIEAGIFDDVVYAFDDLKVLT
jgi:ribosomal protein S18 acetylase RimI-like enzyme